MDVAGPSTECSSAVASTPVEPSTSSEHDPAGGCLNSQGIDNNEVTFEFPLEEERVASIPKHTSDFGCQVNTRGVQLMMKSTETQTYKSSFEVILCDQSTQTDEDFHEQVVISRSPEEDPSQEEITKEIASPNKDPSYVPLKHELSDDSNNSESEEDSKPVNPQNDVKFVVFKEQLDKLLKKCPECGAAIRKKHTSTQGTLFLVTLKCINGHAYTWNSQPTIKGIAAGNLLKSSAILLSGATYTKMATLAEILGLCFFSEKTFCTIQDSYLFPVINEVWEQEQNTVFNDLKGKDLWLSRDGCCDSPGHSAKYGTYTMIDQITDKIVDFQIVQVSEVTGLSSWTMIIEPCLRMLLCFKPL